MILALGVSKMLKSKLAINQIILFFLFFIQIKILPQSGIINNIQSQITGDYVHIMYNLSGDTNSIYNVKFCIKDSSYPAYALFPKIMQGNIGVGKFAGRRNIFMFNKEQLPNDFDDSKKYYYEITASEILDKNNFLNIQKISKKSISLINNGVAVIIGIEDSGNKMPYIENSAKLFIEYCLKVLKIPFRKINYKINAEAYREALKPVFVKDGWLQNNITDGLSDVIIYFAGRSVLSEKNHSIYLLPYGAKTIAEGFSLNELVPEIEGFNPKTATIFIESSVLNNHENITKYYSYPKVTTDNINILLGSRVNEGINNNQHEKMGLFTYEILQGLSGVADLNNDRELTLKELYSFVKREVWDYSVDSLNNEQDPILIPNLGIRGKKDDRILLKYR